MSSSRDQRTNEYRRSRKREGRSKNEKKSFQYESLFKCNDEFLEFVISLCHVNSYKSKKFKNENIYVKALHRAPRSLGLKAHLSACSHACRIVFLLVVISPTRLSGVSATTYRFRRRSERVRVPTSSIRGMREK